MPHHDIPPPANWEDFEDLCLDLWRLIWADPKARKHGRRGQPQAGVDVYGQPGHGSDWEGVQCKLKSQILGKKLTRKEFEDEVAKARTFQPDLAAFTLATTAPRDTDIEAVVRALSKTQQEAGSFRVNVAFWEDVLEEIERLEEDHPGLLIRHLRAWKRLERRSLDFNERDNLKHLLVPGTRSLPEGRLSPGKLLTAAYEVIPFNERGRRNELEDLAAWCVDDRRISVWLWTGEGGTGKSRMMIEWCRRLAAQGWHTGFLHPERTAQELLPLLEGVVSRLVVVDYAETRLNVVRPLLREMALARGDGPKLRLVLLARRKEDWWEALSREAEAVEDLLIASPAIRALTPLVDRGDERLAAFHQAAGAFADAIGSEVPESLPLPNLDRFEFDRILYLHMAALAAARGESVGDSSEALERTLDHERRFWRNEAAILDQDSLAASAVAEEMEAVMAALTLIGGADKAQATKLAERVAAGEELRSRGRATPRDLLRFLRRTYAGARYLEGLQPDLLGEELVAASLQRDAALLDRVLEVADAAGRSHALTLLTRLARRRPETETWLDLAFRDHLDELAELALPVAVETGDPIGRILANRLAVEVSAPLAERLMVRCDERDYRNSVPLWEVADARQLDLPADDN